MTKLTLTNYAQGNTTVLENEFIDRYMASANGEYVKVYLLLLRHMNRPDGVPSVSDMADILECTEKDIRRALKYWKSKDLLDYHEKPEAERTPDSPRYRPPAGTGSRRSDTLDEPDSAALTARVPEEGIAASSAQTAVPSSEILPEADAPPAFVPNIQQYRERKEFKELLFVAEQYLGKTLSSADIDTITYFYDTLHMSAELIEYLIEYCVENGHKSMHYIQKVALSWNDQKLTTVSAAKASTVMYNKNCYSVLNAYGIKGRAPAAAETAYIKKWNDEYGFSLEIILEACNRTMNTIHQPNFEYTDTILKNWSKKQVRCRKDIDTLDADFQKEKERRKKPAVKPALDIKNNKFNNFTGRSYDMDSLERRLVQQ
ncbi:MAG: DnaD domain protein [Dorea sp.]|jgi:DnaD/phage-associated family protein|nr:DnaD domain protein [Dorea sp.]